MRVSDADPEHLRALGERGVVLDAVVRAADIPYPLRAAVWVTPVTA